MNHFFFSLHYFSILTKELLANTYYHLKSDSEKKIFICINRIYIEWIIIHELKFFCSTGFAYI